MKRQTKEGVQGMCDCSNCFFRKDVAPYSVILGCKLDDSTNLMPHTCNKWESLIGARALSEIRQRQTDIK